MSTFQRGRALAWSVGLPMPGLVAVLTEIEFRNVLTATLTLLGAVKTLGRCHMTARGTTAVRDGTFMFVEQKKFDEGGKEVPTWRAYKVAELL